jgi:hypothetical protein
MTAFQKKLRDLQFFAEKVRLSDCAAVTARNAWSNIVKKRLYFSMNLAILALTIGRTSLSAAEGTITPTELQPPSGNELFLKAHATGTQNYICLPSTSGTGMVWSFLGPQATLFVPIHWPGREIKVQVATHFLSPNPAEDAIARPTWQSALDSSAAWARAIATVTDPSIVATGAIPWLLLKVVGTRPGMDSSAGLSQTTFIQRLHTSGGIAPASGCAAATDIGRTAFADYSTDYYFYKAVRTGM